jgi:hypothetical protein
VDGEVCVEFRIKNLHMHIRVTHKTLNSTTVSQINAVCCVVNSYGWYKSSNKL